MPVWAMPRRSSSGSTGGPVAAEYASMRRRSAASSRATSTVPIHEVRRVAGSRPIAPQAARTLVKVSTQPDGSVEVVLYSVAWRAPSSVLRRPPWPPTTSGSGSCTGRGRAMALSSR